MYQTDAEAGDLGLPSELDVDFEGDPEDKITTECTFDFCAPCKRCGVASKSLVIRSFGALAIVGISILIVLCFTIWNQQTVGIIMVAVVLSAVAIYSCLRDRTVDYSAWRPRFF